MRRLGVFPLEEILLALWAPGLAFAVGWTAMYEIYHEEGSYFTTLLQEILGTEGLLPSFLLLVLLLSLPVGMLVDATRQVVGETRLGLPWRHGGGQASAAGDTRAESLPSPGEEFEARYLLYRHARATLLTPAQAAGNLALVLLTLDIWFVVKIVQMGSFWVFSPVFVVGAPLLGLALVVGLVIRYRAGLKAFARHAPAWTAAPAARPGGGDAEPIAPRPGMPGSTSSRADSLPSPLDKAEGRP